MIYANVTLSIEDHSMKADKNIVLYRGDKNVEIRFILKRNKFVVLDNTYAQMIIKRPSARSIFSEPALIIDNTVVFTITEEMIDELKEIGEYTFQIRLFDDNMVARATLPPCNGCLVVNKPIAVEGEAMINVAMINDSAVMSVADSGPSVAAYTPAPAEIPAYDPWAENTPAVAADISEDQMFDENNNYNRTVWLDGDIITDTRMNKIENALYYIKENAGSSNITAPYISTFLPENIMVNTGDDFELDLEFRSQNLGNGTLKVFVNDVDVMTQRIDQGITTTMVPYTAFVKGTNMMVVYVLDRAGVMTNSLTFYVRYGGLEIEATFDAYTAYDYGATVRYYFTPSALDTSIPLTFLMEIDGVLQEAVPCTSDVRAYFTFPTNLGVGNHYCKAWITDGTNESSKLEFNLIILSVSSPSLVVASDTMNPSVEEGAQLILDYKVYMKNNSSFITKTYVDGKLVGTGTCTLETAYYRSTTLTEGTHTVRIEVYDITETYSDYIVWNVTITPSTYQLLEPATAGSVFIASAYNKTNSDENVDKWVGTNQDNQNVTATLTNFAFNSENGWVDDTLIISGNSWVEIPVKPLANNAQYGFTLDIEFSTRPIGAEGAEVLSLWNDADNCGIKITTEQLIIRSKSGNQADLYFSEDEIVSAIFVIDRDEKTAKIYLNGVMCEAFALSDYEAAGQKFLEDFTVNSNVFLGGYNKNGYCAIKNVRIYEVALGTSEILNNFMSNEKNKKAQQALVEFQKGNDLPTLTIYCDFSGLGKDDKKPCNIVYNSPDVNKFGESFTLDGKYSTLQYQGTSSMQYPIKNYRINPADANGKLKLDPFKTGIPESRFTLKADFMSSGHWQNTGLAKWVNDNLYNYKTNDPSTMNARKWYDLQNGGKVTDTRESIAGFPCRLILINDGNTALAEGQQEPTPGNTKDMGIFNFNSDKDNVATMGFDEEIFPNALSYEVTANSDVSAGAFVPYDGEKYIDCYLDGSGWYLTQAMSTSYFNTTSLTVTFDFDNPPGASRYRLRYYDANLNLASDSSYVDNGKTLTVNTSYPYFSFFLSDTTTAAWRGAQWKSITVNGVTYNCGETTRSLVKKDPYVEFTKELEYLQQSFELRFPDADDYGDDHGYLGLNVAGSMVVDYYPDSGSHITSRISLEALGNPTTVVINDINGYTVARPTSTVTFYNESEQIVSGGAYDFIGREFTVPEGAKYVSFSMFAETTLVTINNVQYTKGNSLVGQSYIKDPYVGTAFSTEYGLKRVIDWVGNATDEQFVAEFDQYFHRDYTLRYYLLVIVLGMVDNLGKNMMFDTFDGKIWLPRFYDMDTICSYDNSGEIKFDVDIEMEQGYWNTSASRLWTKIRDLMHDELVLKYNDMRQNGMSYESFMSYFYGQQISQIPQTYYNKDYDVKYAPYADEYMGKAHGDGYEHLKRWLKRRLIFTDTLYDFAPSYTNDALTIRANTLDLMSLEIETYTPVYQHVSFYNGNMEKIKIDGKTPTVFTGYAQTATDQEILIYGGSNVKAIRGLQSMNPDSMLIGNAYRITELDLSNCPILSVVNSNKANFQPHTYLNKLDISNCPQLGGTLNVSGSPLLQDLNALGTAVDNILFSTSLRNLETLRVPKNVSSLSLTDAGLLYTLEMEQGHNIQNVSMVNCNNLTETINFDLTSVPTVLLNNSYNNAEVYMRDTTNLTLMNMSNLERVIFTPNNEYEGFDINNVINGPNYKVTTFNNPKMKDFITTAPHRMSYNGDDVIYREETITNDGSVVEYDNSKAYFKMGSIDYTNGSVQSADNRMYSNFIPWTQTGSVSFNTGNESIHMLSRYFDAEYKHLGNGNGSWMASGTYTVPSNTKYVRFVLASSAGALPSQLIVNGLRISHGNMTISCEYNELATDYGLPILNEEYEVITVKEYGAIIPNSVFAANTLDLADTQFENVKFLCTTDIYNLKVPTTMKNFYCDSAYDIDTVSIEEGSYEITHQELIEPYTTNYSDKVVRYTTTTEAHSYSTTRDQWPNRDLVHGGNVTEGFDGWLSHHRATDFRPVEPGDRFRIYCDNPDSTVGMIFYNANKEVASFIGDNSSGLSDVTGNAPSNAAYVKFWSGHMGYQWGTATTYIEALVAYVPDIVPSSASGSLIFNMYSNNTTKPTSTSPYMWDLTGLKLNDFYTYGMNNHVKPSEDGYINVNNTQLYRVAGRYSGNTFRNIDSSAWDSQSIPPILFAEDIVRIRITTNTGTDFLHYYSSDYNRNTGTVSTQGFGGGGSSSGTWFGSSSSPIGAGANAIRLLTFSKGANVEWFEITTENRSGIQQTTRFYMSDIPLLTLDEFKQVPISDGYTSSKTYQGNPTTLMMPHRMPGYSVRMVNADISPVEQPTMFYPLLVDANLPITGKIDYAKYKGTSLAWAYAFTTDDVDINPVNSQNIGQITFDFNKLYSTDFVDLTDAWIYKDTDVSRIVTNEAITKVYVELTNANYKSRISEALQPYPNCTDLYLFEDGNLTSLDVLFGTYAGVTSNGAIKDQLRKVTFMDGYFSKLNNMSHTFADCSKVEVIDLSALKSCKITSYQWTFIRCSNLKQIIGIESLDMSAVVNFECMFYGCGNLTSIDTSKWKVKEGTTFSETFKGCSKITQAPVIPNGVTNMNKCFENCSALTSPPAIPEGVTNLTNCFYGCAALVQTPTLPNGVTNLTNCFYGCAALVQTPTLPNGVTNLTAAFYGCKSLTQITNIPDTVTIMSDCFRGCTSLMKAPTIPNGVENMGRCYYDCSALTDAGRVPSSVNNLEGTFKNCTSLVNPPEVLTENASIGGMYSGCSNLITANIPIGGDYVYGYQYQEAIYNANKLTKINWLGQARSTMKVANPADPNSSLLRTGNGAIIDVGAAIKDLVNNHLADVTGQNKVLTISSTYLALFTPTELSLATAKGWTIQ